MPEPIKIPEYLIEMYGQDGVRQFIADRIKDYDRLIARVEHKLKTDEGLSPRSQMLALKQIGLWVAAKADLVLRNDLIAPAPKKTDDSDKRSAINFYIGGNLPLDHPLLAGSDIHTGDAGRGDDDNGTASKG